MSSTKQSSNEAESGNKSKPLLGEVDFFDKLNLSIPEKLRILKLISENDVELEFIGFSVFAKPNFKLIHETEVLSNNVFNWLMKKKYLKQKEKLTEDKYIMKISKKGIGKLTELSSNFT